MQIWDIQKNRLAKDWHVQAPEVTALAWSPDNTRLIAIGRDGSAQLWDMTSDSQA